MPLSPRTPWLTLAAAAAANAVWAAAPVAAQIIPTEEVPFITSPDNVTLEMLRIAGVGALDHVIDLGSGDGRIVILAAKRFGASGLGVEIMPDLVDESRRAAHEAGVADRARFQVQDLFQTDLSPATVVTMYLLTEVNLQLRPSLLALKPGTRIVSHDWDMGDWKPDHSTVVPVPDKKVGREKSSKVYFWTVPARVHGLWCGTGPLHDFSLRLTQRHQEVQGELTRRNQVRSIEARMEGTVLRTQTPRDGVLVLQWNATPQGEELRLIDADGALALPKGSAMRRTVGTSCAP